MKLLLDLAVPLITFVVVLTVGLDLSLEDFARVRRRRAVVAAGLLGPLLTLPPTALGLIALLSPPPAIQTGVLLIAVCPIGGISNLYSHLAGASPALSVVLTALSGLMAVVTIPVMDRAFGYWLGVSLGLTPPVPLLVGQLLAMLALPIGLGMWARHRWPDRAIASGPRLRRVGFMALGALLSLVIASDPAAILTGLESTVSLAAAFVVACFGIGWLTAMLVGASRVDRFTLAAEFATRNVAVATAVAVTLAGRVEFAIFATTYFLTEVPIMLAAIMAFRAAQQSAPAVSADS